MSRVNASSGEQPNLPDSGQSEPEPLVDSRVSTWAPGAAAASLPTSPGLSATKGPTPCRWAWSIRRVASPGWSKELLGRGSRCKAGVDLPAARDVEAAPVPARAGISAGCRLALTA